MYIYIIFAKICILDIKILISTMNFYSSPDIFSGDEFTFLIKTLFLVIKGKKAETK